MDLWPPSFAPTAQGLPTSSRPGVRGIVLALAELAADRVDGREVNDIEAHLMDQGQLLRGVFEGAVGDAVENARAGKIFIPSAEGGQFALDEHE